MHYYNIIYASLAFSPPPPTTKDFKRSSVTATGLNGTRDNGTRAIFFPHRTTTTPSLIYSTSISVGFYVCSWNTSIRLGKFIIIIFFPTSNPPVFFLSTRRLGSYILPPRRSAHCDNLLFLHPLTRKYCAHPIYVYTYMYIERAYVCNIYALYYAVQGDFFSRTDQSA
ncbi:unnamed protein product [Aphis gossypii]|uniref:Uncharacterized protein n=1 Tax=Aphis gossypii TaxID=80765 RepID=A0A9P0IT32_APHGO|nr:unnamed protein product [Aphis gossypii]